MTAEKDKQKPPLFSSLFKADIMLGFGALMVGVCALFVSLYEARVIRSQQQTEIWPYITIGPDNVGDRFKLTLRNHGTGPAIIRTARISYHGEPLSTWSEMQTYGVESAIDAIWSNPLSGSVFPAGSDIAIVSVPNSKEFGEAHHFIAQTQFDICYCSLLEECWRIKGVTGGRTARPERTKVACAPDEKDEFYQ